MQLNELQPAPGSTKKVKRLGRGPGSGLGKTSGKGHKGQNARSGARSTKGFEGGQMPLHRRLPKVGFTNIFKKKYALLNLADLERFKSGDVVDEKVLRDAGLIKGNYDGVKLLGEGEIKTSLTLKIDKASKSAVTKVEAAGGKVETE